MQNETLRRIDAVLRFGGHTSVSVPVHQTTYGQVAQEVERQRNWPRGSVKLLDRDRAEQAKLDEEVPIDVTHVFGYVLPVAGVQ